ncbi:MULTISPECIES: tRNA (adenosine(37)-N6)-threonylcarbamoyltransferase complex ATPase subunit type 1 TsaE [unclassified Salinivibrio]|uniref:tRNA (adenosine(37)-N6)-threonylcarbamoyltransferase complex ATPase subunit type 1 TsaE n=1 Tax=unclassified Salinivibrio TaxID=2636825 RepID=UPI0009852F62|nr:MULTISPECIES: tRNA (adenosine(37)-N6)-threonylcarbamoyltransferase complex ATPase subunit type 1 TsaE [unclassified Salinivibrio]OOF12871.1 tRNA (adenosine(37)-N6)-threonylcarbamoyltransferase complex ATPase subunit type 1 TsaE [Salinivibrio sp. PR919]OOF16413.1 tRNA (adenosine(37)-N6)-threonylcarbamoyltransferase complex ATPase subunit type 1 TsaE [Salinivibrio sp. PR932]
MTQTFHTQLADADSTVALGAALARACTQSTTCYLHGDLGAGKTTFCRGFVQAMGHTGNVKSPTYTLVEPYQLPPWQVYHFDLYRLADPEELEFMGIRDYFNEQALCLIEWPEKGKGWLPHADLDITLQYDGEQRTVALTANTEVGVSVINRLEWDD